MTMFVSVNLALGSLRAHRTRTFLTTLGVVIGVFIISLVLIVSGGLARSITDQANVLDNNVVLVRSSGDGTTGMEAFSPLRVANATILTRNDFKKISDIVGPDNLSLMMFLGGSVSGDSSYDNITTVATDHILPSILNLKLASGDWFSSKETSRNWVILGSKLAAGLIGTDQAMGQTVKIKGQTFTVVGILSTNNQPISLAGVDVDKTAFISMENGQKFTNKTEQIGQILIKTQTKQQAKSVISKVDTALKTNHVDDSEYAVRTGSQVANSIAGWLSTITLAALIFAGISLLVGGIGIMNIMLVSVAERIREIGIRKAVGATKRQILNQFLLEALFITLAGAIIGLGLAYGAGYLIGLQFSLPLVFSWWIFAIGIGIPLLTGLIFGIWPAARAARQDPIVALRQYQ